MTALSVPASPLYAKLDNIDVCVVAPALEFVILVTLDPTATLSSVLLSVYPCASLGLDPELLSPNVSVLLLNPLGAAMLGSYTFNESVAVLPTSAGSAVL